jgi:hypothetical protein
MDLELKTHYLTVTRINKVCNACIREAVDAFITVHSNSTTFEVHQYLNPECAINGITANVHKTKPELS